MPGTKALSLFRLGYPSLLRTMGGLMSFVGIRAIPFPMTIPGLQLWVDSSNASTLYQNSNGTTPATADNDPVGYWGDLSGNGRNATQSTAASRLTLKLAVRNGLNVLRLDGTDDWMTLGDNLDNPSAMTVLSVVAGAAGGSGSGCILGRWSGAGAAAGWAIYGRGRYAHFGTDGFNYRFWDTGADYADSTFRLFTTTWDLATSTLTQRVNGAVAGSVTSAGTTTTTSNGLALTLGVMNGGAGFFLAGDAAEVLVYNSVLSAADRLAVEAYLQAKWGTP